MAVVNSLVVFSSTLSTLTTDDAWASLVGGPHSFIVDIAVPTNGVLFEAYVLGLPGNARIRIVVDGTEVVKGSPEAPLLYLSQLVTGPHSVDFQCLTAECEENVQAGPRALVALELGPPTP